jgi:ribonuclease P protein component
MLPSHTRLSRSQVTNLLLNNNLRVVFNRIGTLKYVISLENNGFTVVTGSKHQKKAVLRNKVRRQLYTLFKQYKGISAEAILYVSKQVYDMTYIELQQNLYALLEKAQKNP